MSAPWSVLYADEEPNGLARMIGGLIEANLLHDPDRARLLRAGVVGLDAIDAGVSVTLRFAGGRAAVANGAPNPRAHVRVLASSADLIRLSGAPLRFGLPDLARPEGRAIVRAIFRRRIRVRGLLRHPIRVTRLTRLLSVS